jgi:type IV pilus assembly protein PilC
MSARTTLARAYFDLATLLNAGVPILRSFDILIEGRRGHFKHVLSQIRQSLSDGASLSEALNTHGRRTFPELDRMLIDTADTSGSLPAACSMLCSWHEFMHKINRRIQAGMIYPCFILAIAAFIAGMPSVVLGQITPTQYFAHVARILMWMFLPIAAIVLFRYFRERLPALRATLDFVVLQIPVLGQAVYHLSVCRYAKAFGMLYNAGVPMTEATERATRATGNVIVARLFAGARETVRSGSAAWEGFSKRLSPEYLHLWQVGEETGELDKTVAKVAEIAADRADLFFTAFASWLPKVAYIIIVIVIIVTMVLPLARQIAAGYSSALGGF